MPTMMPKQGYPIGTMLRLTCGMFGMQLVWSIMMVNGTPFLLSLGISQHLTSIVWLAGPLCGAVIQPIVGSYSDRCTHRWGRRKPYLFGGAIGTVASLLGLAYCSAFVPVLVQLFGFTLHESTSASLVKMTAIFWVYLLNIFLQPLQFGMRTLILEQSSTELQPAINAWASRFSALGNVAMCAVGFVDTSNWLPPSWDRFHSLVLVAVVILTLTVAITFTSAHENLTWLRPYHEGLNKNSIITNLLEAWVMIPELSFKVCQIQFLSWMGWFPILFYSSSYVSDMYLVSMTNGERRLAFTEHDDLWHQAVGRGNLSGFVIALVTLFILVTLPPSTARLSSRNRQRALGRLWSSSQMVLFVTMFSTAFVQNYLGAIMLMAISGASWAVTMWVPFTLIGLDLARWNDAALSDELDADTEGVDCRDALQNGGILGLHNLSIAAPQMVSALVASVMFSILSHFDVKDAFGWMMRAGGVAALAAACMIIHLDVGEEASN